MNDLVLAGLLGGVGGLTRGVVGLLKALALKRKILWSYWAITVTILTDNKYRTSVVRS